MKVSVTKEKLDALANAVSSKSGESIPLTIDEMTDAVDGIQTGGTPTLQTKSVTPTETAQTVTADAGYDGLDEVDVGAISSTYVGSGITRRDGNDLEVDFQLVAAPAGYYEDYVYTSVETTTHPSPTASINSSTGLVTASHTQHYGYVTIEDLGGSTGTTTGTLQLSTQSATTITPTTSSQTAVAAGKYTTGAVTVGAIPSSYVQPTATQGATTYNTSTSNQTIASGTYLTGTQTIRAVTTGNLTAANIKAGTTVTVGDSANASRIASVTGTYTSDATASASEILSGETAYVNGSKVTGTLSLTTVYTGSSAPSSSTGSNGDIYIQS